MINDEDEATEEDSEGIDEPMLVLPPIAAETRAPVIRNSKLRESNLSAVIHIFWSSSKCIISLKIFYQIKRC